jgi:hypothetical protein
VIEKTKVVVRDRIVKVPVPTPAPTTPPPAPRDPSITPGGDQFRDTGLAREIRFEDTAWRATSTVTMTAQDLKSIGTAEDGSELFVSMDASAPYQNVLVPVPDEAGKYVSYQNRK